MASKLIGAGFRSLFYGVNDDDGEFIGSTTTTPVAGNAAGSGMLRLDGARVFPLNMPEADVLNVSGDDEPMVTFDFDSENLPSGVLEIAQADNVFDALVQGTKIHTVGDIEYSVLDPKGRVSQSMCLLIQRRSKSWLSGERGTPKWQLYFVKQCTIKPLGSTITQREFNPENYSFNISRADLGMGFSINETDQGTTAMSVIRAKLDNPVHYHRHTGDGVVLTYTLAYAPISAAKTYVYLDHIRQTVTVDYSISGTSLIFVVAPGNNVKIETVYEVEEADLF